MTARSSTTTKTLGRSSNRRGVQRAAEACGHDNSSSSGNRRVGKGKNVGPAKLGKAVMDIYQDRVESLALRHGNAVEITNRQQQALRPCRVLELHLAAELLQKVLDTHRKETAE